MLSYNRRHSRTSLKKYDTLDIIFYTFFAGPNFVAQNSNFYTATALDNATFGISCFAILKRQLMLGFLSSMLCTSNMHPFSIGNYLGTSLIIGNVMRIRVTSAKWTWLGLEWPLAQCVAKRRASLLSSFLLENSLYSGVDKIIVILKSQQGIKIRWQLLTWVRNTQIFGLLFQEFLRIFVFVWSYKLLFHTIYILLKLAIYISSYYLCFPIPSIIRQLDAICHINEQTTPQ